MLRNWPIPNPVPKLSSTEFQPARHKYNLISSDVFLSLPTAEFSVSVAYILFAMNSLTGLNISINGKTITINTSPLNLVPISALNNAINGIHNPVTNTPVRDPVAITPIIR